MSAIWLALISFASGLFSFTGKLIEMFKTQQIKNEAKEEAAGKIAVEQADIIKQQSEILVQNQTKEKTIDKLNDGKF